MVDKKIGEIENPNDYEFIIKCPKLVDAVLICFDPTYWVLESYHKGRWELLKGDLGDFFLTIIKDAPQRLKKRHSKIVRKPLLPKWGKMLRLTEKQSVYSTKHYDHEHDHFFERALDSERVYTCAFFSRRL